MPGDNVIPGATPDSQPKHVTAGTQVGGGRYTLIQPLGRGGMGEVWLAQDERLHEQVALKFLPPEVRADPGALDELRRETSRSHKLSHPNIVRIHDLHEEVGALAFIAMEFVDGPTLAALRLHQPERVLRWEFLKPLVQQLCAALDYAHSEKVIHRDLKPANMMLDSRGRLKLADFGIAATVSDSVSRVSLRHATSGTLAYMSPQQLAGKRPQVTDDIYALGAMLYELLTSQPPFYTGDISYQVVHETAEPLAERLAALGIQNDIPPDVSAMVMACLSKDPAQRPQSAGAVAEWIGLELGTEKKTGALLLQVSRRHLAEPPAEAEEAEEAVPEAEEPADTKSKAGLWIGLGVAAALVLGLGGWWALTGKSKTQASTAKAAPAAPVIAPLESTVPGPKKTGTIDLGGGVKMEFVLIRPGSFTMGLDIGWSVENPAHKVTLTKPFYLGKFEVTQEQWQTVMGSNPSGFKGPKLPVENFSWNDCQSFLAKLQEKTGRKFALPTEAQWEYACRAGTTTHYSFGDSDVSLAEHGWFSRNSGGTTHLVGEKKPNPWGLYDMHGNVWEWCADWYANYPSGDATDPQGASSGSSHVLRGGAWYCSADGLRSASRDSRTPDVRYYGVGLRCVMLVGEASH